MKDLIVAEKPSVARDIALVLGANKKREGYYEGNSYIVTWALGHLLAIAEPHEMNPDWQKWSLTNLPILPKNWPLIVIEKTKEQFTTIKKLFESDEIKTIICATDAGREGELIFRYICEKTGARNKQMKRLWISSLTKQAIENGFRSLRDLHLFDGLADSAKARNRADWLVGMNLSRAYSLIYKENLSVGRVQTPTLAMVVERELAIQNFVPEEYHEVKGTFSKDEDKKTRFSGAFFEQSKGSTGIKAKRFQPSDPTINEIVEQVKNGQAAIQSLTDKKIKEQPPLLYDLTQLQRDANKLYGFSAKKTLDIAQSLYEQKKLISYPRTDSRYLTKDMAQNLDKIIEAISDSYRQDILNSPQNKPIPKRYVNDLKASEHHAIIPTEEKMNPRGLNNDESKIYDLICRRFLAAWQDDHIKSVTTIITKVSPKSDKQAAYEHLFFSRGSRILDMGWKSLEVTSKTHGDKEHLLPAELKPKDKCNIESVEILEKKTTPPPRLTDASLLTAMETAGSSLEEKKLSEAMRDSGLGTPATRAIILENLLKRGYIERQGKSFHATPKGIFLIERIHSNVKSPSMTGQWEYELRKIERGEKQLQPFIDKIEEFLTQFIKEIVLTPPGSITNRCPAVLDHMNKENTIKSPAAVLDHMNKESTTKSPAAVLDRMNKESTIKSPAAVLDHMNKESTTKSPAAVLDRMNKESTIKSVPKEDLQSILKLLFGFETFRPFQKEVCQDLVNGSDVLLVMPTGSGKSLCYQLPGIARGGTTLVISPLIALMEDQVTKLKQMGFHADAIHSGRVRLESREVCRQYIDGQLQFLFIAPERLGVRGFPELLAKNPPTLIAIDEAHCISHWGHDFRPDYRMLKERLPLFRKAPVLALTATATPLVQKDIREQLDLIDSQEHIHGFKRDNIAIEIIEVGSESRYPLVEKFVLNPKNRPAIIYTPTRKQAEQVAAKLNSKIQTKAYHAGLPPGERSEIQKDFLSNALDVITATTAFGMGVDKSNIRSVIHMSIPGSIEAYYQEIGRAGRDGIQAKAILFYSYSDHKTHEFFYNKNYPEVEVLKRLFKAIPNEGIHKSSLQIDMDFETLDIALEKLWIHGGIQYTPEDYIFPMKSHWEKNYLAQRQYKEEQLRQVEAYAKTINQCRMVFLVHHFGDKSNHKSECGICDICSPSSCDIISSRKQTPFDTQKIHQIFKYLIKRDDVALGRLFKDVFKNNDVERDLFECWIKALTGQGYLTMTRESFTKKGIRIDYRTVALTGKGRKASLTDYANITISDIKSIDTSQDGFKMKTSKTIYENSKEKKKKQSANSQTYLDEKSCAHYKNLIEDLRNWRRKEAETRKIPAFCIIPDRTLYKIVEEQPRNENELLTISGIGAAKANMYGSLILKILKEHNNIN